MTLFKKATLATALAASALASATPAMARDHYNRRGNDTAAIAIGAGIVGLAIGAIVASGNKGRRDRDDYYYRNNGWEYRDGYYWDRSGNRYDRDGRRYDDDRYYARRGYGDDRFNGYRGY